MLLASNIEAVNFIESKWNTVNTDWKKKNFGTCSLDCSRRLNRGSRRSDGGERVESCAGKTTEKKESRGDMSSQFVLGSFSLSIFLPALYYLNAWNRLLVDYSNIKKMQPFLN